MIDILMAVYNGEEFLEEQIGSVLAQEPDMWHLYICDDCSSDGSFRIASEYEKKYPRLVTAYRNDVPTGSACANFMGMLRRSKAEYVMFSDQDDVWLPQKVKLTMEKMRELEGKFPDSPLLVHTELAVADRELNVTSPSFTRFQGLDPRCRSLNRLLCQNNITGCTLMMNRALAELIKDAPPEYMLMHDWWAGLAAAAFGHIGFVETPLIKYRQHEGNQLGAVNNRNVSGIVRFVKKSGEAKERIAMTYRQAERFFEYYRSALDKENAAVLETYTDIPRHFKLSRTARLVKHGFLKQNFLAAAGQIIFC